MKGIFDLIMKVFKNPIYVFDVAIVSFMMPRFAFIFRGVYKVLEFLSRLFESTRGVVFHEQTLNDIAARRAAQLIMLH